MAERLLKGLQLAVVATGWRNRHPWLCKNETWSIAPFHRIFFFKTPCTLKSNCWLQYSLSFFLTCDEQELLALVLNLRKLREVFCRLAVMAASAFAYSPFSLYLFGLKFLAEDMESWRPLHPSDVLDGSPPTIQRCHPLFPSPSFIVFLSFPLPCSLLLVFQFRRWNHPCLLPG